MNLRERVSSPEAFVLTMVDWSRDDEDDGGSAKDLRKAARKRRRRLGIAAFAAGPLAGAAGEATDLYSETATVCDLVDHHDLELSDLDIGAHMLVLWGVAADVASGRAALDGSGPSITALLQQRWYDALREEWPERFTVISTIKLIWKARGLRGDIADAAGAGAFKRVLRAGSQSKDLIARAEAQLLSPP